jgi:hypothetical protein
VDELGDYGWRKVPNASQRMRGAAASCVGANPSGHARHVGTGQRRYDQAQGLSEELLTLWPALWTFAVIEDVEPTNNAAERALRPAVLWRKRCFGAQSEAGNTFVERILTVRIVTVRLQPGPER